MESGIVALHQQEVSLCAVLLSREHLGPLKLGFQIGGFSTGNTASSSSSDFTFSFIEDQKSEVPFRRSRRFTWDLWVAEKDPYSARTHQYHLDVSDGDQSFRIEVFLESCQNEGLVSATACGNVRDHPDFGTVVLERRLQV